jgi:hypothetical protein
MKADLEGEKPQNQKRPKHPLSRRLECGPCGSAPAYDPVYQGFVRGFIPEEEVAITIPTHRAERDSLIAELQMLALPPSVVSLHPAAVTAYVKAVERLEVTLESAARSGRQVIVHPPTPDAGVAAEVRGYLSKLIGEDLFPNTKVPGGHGSGRGTRTPDTRIMMQILSQRFQRLKTPTFVKLD